MSDSSDDDMPVYQASKPPNQDWMLTLADLLSLLMVFFVMIHIILMTKNSKKLDGLVRSFNKQLNTPTLQIVEPFTKTLPVEHVEEKEPPKSVFYWFNFFNFFLDNSSIEFGTKIIGRNLYIDLPEAEFSQALYADEENSLITTIAGMIGKGEFKAEIIRYLYLPKSKDEYQAQVRRKIQENERLIQQYSRRFDDYNYIDNIVIITDDKSKKDKVSLKFYQADQ